MGNYNRRWAFFFVRGQTGRNGLVRLCPLSGTLAYASEVNRLTNTGRRVRFVRLPSGRTKPSKGLSVVRFVRPLVRPYNLGDVSCPPMM
jgi:hypothetical protein